MDPYVAAGYGVTLITLGAYALRILRRGRVLTRSASEPTVPAPASEEKRR